MAMKSNCLIEAVRIYRALARDDKPGSAAWICFRRSWEKGVPFHAAAGKSSPYTDAITIVHFQPVEKKRRAWWPEWTLSGFIKRGDFPATEAQNEEDGGFEPRVKNE